MHLFIIEHCGNKYIIDMMQRVFEENTRIIISSKQNQAHIHDAKHEHMEILNLLINDKYAEAEAAMRTHIEECRRAALDYFLNNQVYTSSTKQLILYKKSLKNTLNIQIINIIVLKIVKPQPHMH